MTKHPTEKGSVREVIGIALPMLVSFACDTVMIFTDRVYMAKLGPTLMNAVLGGGLSAWMMMGFVMGLTGYTTALAAQYLGAGEKKKCALVLTQSFFIIAVFYPALILCRPLAHYLFQSMHIPPEQLAPQIEYFDMLVYGTLAMLTRHAMSSFFSGIGRTRIVMTAALVTMLVNVGLAYVFIYGKFGIPAMGIKGAALASVASSAAGVLVLLSFYLSREISEEFSVRSSFSFDAGIMRKLWWFGTPPGLEMFLNILGFNMIVMLFHSTGPVGATAASVVLNWDLVSFVPLLGVEIGVTSLVGRYMGAREPELAHRSAMSGMKFGFIYSAIVFILFVTLPEMLVRVFDPGTIDRELFASAVPVAVWMLRLASLYVFLQTAMVAITGALRGAGDTFWAMAMMVGVHWVLVVLLWIEFRILGWPLEAGWITLIAVFFVFTGVFVYRYRLGRWQKIHVID